MSNLILLLAVVAGWATLCQIPPLFKIERALLDLRAGLAPVPAESPVVALQISDRALTRAGLVDLLERVASQQPRAVLLYQPLPSPYPSDAALRLQTLREEWSRSPEAGHSRLWKKIRKDLRQFEQELDHDSQLVRALREAGNVVLVSPIRVGDESEEVVADLRKFALPLELPKWNWQQQLKHFSNPVEPPWANYTISAVELPWDELLRQAAATGYSVPADQGKLEAGLLLLSTGERFFPSAGLATLMVAEGASFSSLKFVARGSSSVLLAGKRSFQVDRSLRLLPLPESFLSPLPVMTFEDIADEGEASLLKNRVVVIGNFSRPDSPDFSSARLISQMLGDYQLSRPGWLPILELLMLGFFAFFLWLLVPRLSMRMSLVLTGLFLVGWVAVATLLLMNIGWWLLISPALILTVFGVSIQYYLKMKQQRRKMLIELNCQLGDVLQEKGLLDQALERYESCPFDEEQTRERLYNLAQDYERKRRFGHALGVYEKLQKAGRYKDVAERVNRLRSQNGHAPLGSQAKDSTVVLGQGAVHPTLGRYEIANEIGQGAMGTVYLGRDPKINREVAIKTLSYGSVDDTQLPMIKERFFREAEAAGRLNHPGIVTIFDAGEEHDLAYLAMEFLSGKDLSVHCKPKALLEPAEVLRIVADVADALAYAHANEVVHRDIKPANIMLLSDNSIKVTDFGIARVVSSSQTQTGMVLGTPSYMSPEQVAAKKVDGRSDLFSLGSVCYELLSGEKAFVGDSMASLMYNISNVNYAPLKEKRKKLPKCCYDLVDALLVKAVSRRPKDASEVAAMARSCSEKARK